MLRPKRAPTRAHRDTETQRLASTHPPGTTCWCAYVVRMRRPKSVEMERQCSASHHSVERMLDTQRFSGGNVLDDGGSGSGGGSGGGGGGGSGGGEDDKGYCGGGGFDAPQDVAAAEVVSPRGRALRNGLHPTLKPLA
eukprot:3732168-Pleurochrysis_carterae.AAC.4